MITCKNKECTQINPQLEENFELCKEDDYLWRRGKCKTCRALDRKNWLIKNRDKFNTYMRDYAAANKHTRKWKIRYQNRSLKQRYGITLQQFNEMKVAQDNKCAICLRSKKKLVMDHCHKSSKVRGALCYRCNRLMAVVDNTPDLIKNALAYKEKHPEIESAQTNNWSWPE
jgi:hypothetical protein